MGGTIDNGSGSVCQTHSPQRLNSWRKKLEFRCPAPEGASGFERLVVSLKRYPDTKRDPYRVRLLWVFGFGTRDSLDNPQLLVFSVIIQNVGVVAVDG